MKLFALYIGGEHPRANIELHDMRFVIARTVAETHEALRQQWWGTPGTLHIDAYAVLDHADGYDIELSPEPFTGRERLFYVHLGGYDEADFIERHRNVFVVARTMAEAKTRALRENRGWSQLHRDEQYEAEQVVALADAAREERLYVHLRRSAVARGTSFVCRYVKIKEPRRGRRAVAARARDTSER